MDYDDKFTLHLEDHGSFLHIFIPGTAPGVRETQTIRWTGMATPPKSKDIKRDKQQLVRSLRRSGKLKNLPQKTVPGYDHGYAYDVRFAIPYEISPVLDNLVYTRNDVAHVTNHMLWFPIMDILRENEAKYSHILIDAPVFPKVVTEHFYQSWYESNQKASPFVQRVQDGSTRTRIQRTETEDAIILQIKNHMFEGQPTLRLRVNPYAPMSFIPPKYDEKMEDLKRRIFARDAYLLRGLDDRARKCLARGQSTPLSDDYKLHWKNWLSLDGTRTRENAILVPNDIELFYRASVRAPVENYLKKYSLLLAKAGKPIYVDVPIPMAHYRNKPIARHCSKRQDRRALNRIARQDALEYMYGD